MTKEFKNLLDLLRSNNPDNVYLAVVLAQNFKEEFEKYVKCSLEDYEELYCFLVKYASIKGLLTGIKRINWSFWSFPKPQNVKIKELPKSIKILQKIKNLDFSNNEITELPAEIGELTNLQYLHLSENPLEKLPKEIRKLEKLHALWLYGIKFDVFPPEIATIKNLKYLYLDYLQVEKFAKEIKILKKSNRNLQVEDDDLPF